MRKVDIQDQTVLLADNIEVHGISLRDNVHQHSHTYTDSCSTNYCYIVTHLDIGAKEPQVKAWNMKAPTFLHTLY